MSRSVALSAILLTALIAGCAGDPRDPDTQEVIPESIENVEVTDTTGAIRGVVVTDAIVPIEGALVALSDGLNTTTDVDGGFVFNGLAPGDYFLQASMEGYLTQQASAVVVAGDAEPVVTKIILPVSGVLTKYTTVQQWSAFLQCGFNAFAVSVNPCAFTGSDNVHDMVFDAGRIPDYSQGEAIWTGSQPAGNWLWFSIHDPETSNSSCITENSQSPAILKYNQTQIIECYGEESEAMTYKVFPGNSEDAVPVPTVLTNQQYDIYVQYFYGFVPREDYTLAEEGVCSRPEDCS